MNKYIILANGTPLDTNEVEGISLNYQIQDILDITKRNTSYSKTITLPGTPHNNRFFQQIFDVNIDNINFNPNLRIPANINVGDNEILTGNLQLVNIFVDNKDIRYEVVVSGSLRDILGSLSDYNVKDLNFSEYDHIRNKTNILNSHNYTIQKWGNTTDVQSGDGYVYPYIISGNSDDIYSDWYIYDAFPALYVKTILDKLFDFSDFTYTSNFFNSEYFRKLIIPYGEDKIQLDDEAVDDRTLMVGVNGNSAEVPGGSSATGYASIQYNTVNYESGWHYNSDNNYYMPLYRESGTIGDVDFQDNLNQSNQTGYYNQNEGYYDINFSGKLVPKWWSDNGEDVRWKGDGSVEYIYYLYIFRASGGSQVLDRSGPAVLQPGEYGTLFYDPSNTDENASPWYDTTAELEFGLSADNIWLEPGDRISIRFGVNWPSAVKWDISNTTFNQNQKMNLLMTLAESVGGEPTTMSIKPASNASSGNELINMNQMAPNIKQKDFFLNIVKMFNLIIQDNPAKANDLIIEPRDDFFKSREKVVDWNDKLDNDSDVKITPMSELDATAYRYKYKADKDFFNEEYTEETGKEYGELLIDVINDFSERTKKTELIFSPTPNAEMFINERVAPFFCDIVNNELKPKKVKPRILFYSGPIGYYNGFRLRDNPGESLSSAVNMDYYPYCGMWDDPTSPTYDLGFGRTDKIYWDAQQIPVNNLYEQFHKSTLLSVSDINSRLLTATFWLTPTDIALFDFRDIIFLLGSYWRVNKIKDYNPVGSDSLTKVVLYKLVDINIYQPDRVSIPTSNDSCPTDVVLIRGKKGWYHVSESGSIITEDCCEQLGGRWKNGACYNKVIGHWNPKDNPKRPLSATIGGIDVTPISEKYGPVSLQKNNNSINRPGVSVLGRNNYVPQDAEKAFILGNDNTMLPGIKDSVIIGNNITATDFGTIYLGDIKIDQTGNITTSRNLVIDGGEDIVFPVNKTNLIDILDGSNDSVRNRGGDSKARPIIDGSGNSRTEPG
jgi:hypothetical protein